MSDEKKEQEETETFEETMKNMGLEKIKTPEDLANAYIALRETYSGRKPQKNGSNEDLLEKTQKFFEGSHDGKVQLEGELGEIAQNIVDEIKIHPRLAEAAVAKVSGSVAYGILEHNKKESLEALKDEETRRRVEETLAKTGETKDFQERLKNGKVTKREIELLSKIQIGEQEENNGGIERTPEITVEQAELEWENSLRPEHPRWNTEDPKHAEAMARLNKIKKILGLHQE